MAELKIGGRYNWRNQPERLIYVGRNMSPGQSRWHQFEKVGKPGDVWCEVHDGDLHMIEATPQEGADGAREVQP